jgi:hypothetical protein
MRRQAYASRAALAAILAAHAQHAAAASPSLCSATEQVAFSCPIAKTAKIVSLCLTMNGTGAPGGRYVFGTELHQELVYPSKPNRTDLFRRAHLAYAGATGGNAFSFTTANTKYILYQISGTGVDRSGVLVQPVGHLHASADLSCRDGTAAGALTDEGLDSTRLLSEDPDLTDHGLPSLH